MEIKIMMTVPEQEFLKEVVTSLNPNSVIFELGTAFGGSAALMASANPSAKIFTIDLHENNGLNVVQETYYHIKTILEKYSNITSLCGNAMTDFTDWDTRIDLYLEDGAHENPALQNNLNRWTQFLKPKGLLLMHDNNKHCPDVERNIDRLVKSGTFEKIKQVESLTLLKKNKEF